MSLREQIDSLNPWFYDFDLCGEPVVSGQYPPGPRWDQTHERLLLRQAQRKLLLVDAVAERIDLKGASVLDVGCNCAYWSWLYVRDHGADRVVGIEGRLLHINQAELIFEWSGLRGRGTFLHGDARALLTQLEETFDVVLCAGLLYHVPDPLLLLWSLIHASREWLVIDTRVAPLETYMEEPDNRYFNSLPDVERRVLVPSRRMVVETMESAGFDVEVIPPPWKHTPGAGCAAVACDDYHLGRRICCVGRRR